MAEANRNDSSTNSQSKQISGSQDGTVPQARVSVQGFKPLVGHFACLCRGFEFYEVKKKMLLYLKKKMEILLHFLSFFLEPAPCSAVLTLSPHEPAIKSSTHIELF